MFGSTIFFGTDTLAEKASLVQRCRFNFMREAQIWYTGTSDQRVLSADFENIIVLSDEFYQELVSHSVPNDLEVVKLLAESPAVLDLYMWLSYSFKAKGVETIPLFGQSYEIAFNRSSRTKLSTTVTGISIDFDLPSAS